MKIPIIYKMDDLPPRRSSKEYDLWLWGNRFSESRIFHKFVDTPADLPSQMCMSEIALRTREDQTRLMLDPELHHRTPHYHIFNFQLEQLYLEYQLWNEDTELMLRGGYTVHKRTFGFYLHTELEIDDCRPTIATALTELAQEEFNKRKDDVSSLTKSTFTLMQLRKINAESETVFRGIENWKNKKQ